MSLRPWTRFVFLWLALFHVCAAARADVANLGIFSFDQLNPGAVNSFTIINFTFDFFLPPDFPVADAITFQNARVTLTDSNGTVLAPILLGDLGAGVTTPSSLDFLSTDSFDSAEFTASLNPLSFVLSDGTTFVADTNLIDTILLPAFGSTLVAGSDLAVISVNGSIQTTAPVPEPSTWLFSLTSIVLISAIKKPKESKRIRQSQV